MIDRKTNGFRSENQAAISHSRKPPPHPQRLNESDAVLPTAPNNSTMEESKNIRVFLRLRPMNKLELSRRSRNCVEVYPPGIYGSTELTVDSPLEGEYDFNFDQVFEGDATQAAVYSHAGAPFAKKVVEGRNCAIIVYGQSGSGKTSTIFGNQYATNASGDSVEKSESKMETKDEESGKDMQETKNEIDTDSGITPRIVRDIFEAMDNAPANTEFTVRVSYIEIYLEQIRDLLNPSRHFLKILDSSVSPSGRLSQNSNIKKSFDVIDIEGLSELCCIDESDVLSLLARGNAYRVISDHKNQTDLKQSHSIFILKIEQKDTITNKVIVSKLHLVDMAGSGAEGKGIKASKKKVKPKSAVYQLETRIFNRAHSAIGNVFKALTEKMQKQKNQNSSSPSCQPENIPYKESKLTNILRDAFGGNCLTAFVLTASPASFNISTTIATMRFGQKCRRIKNNPMINMVSAPEEFGLELERLERRDSELTLLAQTLSAECEWIKAEIKNNEESAERLSDEVNINRLDDILKRNKYLYDAKGSGAKYNNRNDANRSAREDLIRKDEEIKSLKIKLEELSKTRDRVHSLMLEIQAECAVLRTESETVLSAKRKNTLDLIDAQNEIQDLGQRKLEVEHNLRTSQFRETEATVFLRQFRRFYKRLLEMKASEGSGNISDIMSKFGVPDHSDMNGIDNFMVASGLLEVEEVNSEEMASAYRPSVPALLRSSSSAKQAEIMYSSLSDDEVTVEQLQQSKLSGQNGDADSKAAKSLVSARTVSTDTLTTDKTTQHSSITTSPSIKDMGHPRYLAEKQMKLHTPAGMSSKMRLEQLEEDISEMSRICIELQIALNEEREYNEVLSKRHGARSKRRMAEEAISARRELAKKTNDVQALVWKVNELHLINKTYEEKLRSREEHVSYLEESLAHLNQNRIEVACQHQTSDKKFRKEIVELQNILNTMTKPLWQYGEGGKRTLESRMIIPVQGGNRDIVDDAVLSQTGQGRNMDTSGSSKRTTTSIDMRVGSPLIPIPTGRSKARTYYEFTTQTDHSEAGISYSTMGRSSIASSIFIDKGITSLRHADMSEDESTLHARPGSRDGQISLAPLVEEMTLTSKELKTKRDSDEGSQERENVTIEGADGIDNENAAPKQILFPGRNNDYIPRRFSKKFGPLIKTGVLKPNKRLRDSNHNEAYFRQPSRDSLASSLSSPTFEPNIML